MAFLVVQSLCALPANAQDAVSAVLVCIPDTTGTLTESVSPCPSSPIAAPGIVNGVVITGDEYNNLLVYDGPISQTEGYNLALASAGVVLACYALCLGIGTVLGLIRRA